MKNYRNFFTQIIRSNKYFVGVLIFFIFEALWIALSGRYPMAFDEDFHFGVIKLYAHHISPFLSHQPDNADAFGAIFRDPSYLYHYLLSFPYRLITVFTKDQTIQIIMLRIINIGLFTSSLPLFKKLLMYCDLSSGVSNLILSLFILVPIVPLLAAQINYDNLLIPLVALSLILAYKFATELRSKHHINPIILFELIIICLLSSLVQYEFLPIFFAIIIFVGIVLYKTPRHHLKLLDSFLRNYKVLAKRARLALVFIIVICSVLFVQRYGVNAVSYKSPLPDCRKVLNVQRCSAYGPWVRNYIDAQYKQNFNRSPVWFTGKWIHDLWLRSFFTLAGVTNDFETRGPLMVPSISAIVILSSGIILLLTYSKQIYKKYNHVILGLFTLAIILYGAVLWIDGYRDYLATGQPVALNGRYLLPLLVPVMAIFTLAYVEFFRHYPNAKVFVASIALLCFVMGGGFLTFVIRSNDSWYWPNQNVRTINHALQKTVDPIIPSSQNYDLFL